MTEESETEKMLRLALEYYADPLNYSSNGKILAFGHWNVPKNLSPLIDGGFQAQIALREYFKIKNKT